MLTRRELLSFTVGSIAAGLLPSSQQHLKKLALYASAGSEMLHYDVDVTTATLLKRGSVTLPAAVQYAWPHASRRCLYVACSDGSKRHCVTALRIDPRTGELSKLGEPVALPARPINITTDLPSDYVLVAFNAPSGVRVFRINGDLTIGVEIPEPGVTDGGIFAHQIRVAPDDRHAILVTRGISATATTKEDPGALKMFDYRQGMLSNESSIAPNGGFGFGPRHLDFHPTKPWVYVSLERESKLFMYRLEHGRISAENAYSENTLADPGRIGPRQLAGAIHVHPNGRFVYVSNRNDATVDFKGSKVSAGGENSIVVFAIDQATGQPVEIQHIETRKVYPRTFCIDPTGRLMAIQHVLPIRVRDGDGIRTEAAGSTIFRIGSDGKLTYVREYDVELTGSDQMFWGGMVPL